MSQKKAYSQSENLNQGCPIRTTHHDPIKPACSLHEFGNPPKIRNRTRRVSSLHPIQRVLFNEFGVDFLTQRSSRFNSLHRRLLFTICFPRFECAESRPSHGTDRSRRYALESGSDFRRAARRSVPDPPRRWAHAQAHPHPKPHLQLVNLHTAHRLSELTQTQWSVGRDRRGSGGRGRRRGVLSWLRRGTEHHERVVTRPARRLIGAAGVRQDPELLRRVGEEAHTAAAVGTILARLRTVARRV